VRDHSNLQIWDISVLVLYTRLPDFLLGCLYSIQASLLVSVVSKLDIILITVFVQVTSHCATLLLLL
jgi:hypothetical protein